VPFAQSPSFCVLTCPSLCSLVNAPLSGRGETGKFPPCPPLLAVIAKYVHCAAHTCRTQQAQNVRDEEKIAMNGFLRFQVLGISSATKILLNFACSLATS